MELMLLLVLVVAIAAIVGYTVYKYYPKDRTTILPFEEVIKEDIVKVEEKIEEVVSAATTEVKDVTKKVVKKAKAEVAEKRARKAGKFVADDPATPDVNEAFIDGKAPPKKVKKPKIEVSK